MNQIEKNSVQFDYFSSNYHQFEEDYYKFSDVPIPLTFLTDDILKLMLSKRSNYFKLNAKNAKDKRDHYFLFNAHTHADNPDVLLFEYIGHRYQMSI